MFATGLNKSSEGALKAASNGTVKGPSRGGKPSIGFLTVLEDENGVLFGGFLVLNLAGRPLEFLCTAPIRPNRAQEILYGPTLEPFLYGEQIGATLLEKAKSQPLLICTDQLAALALSEHTRIPVAFVENISQSDSVPDETKSFRIDSSHTDSTPSKSSDNLFHTHFGNNLLAFIEDSVLDQNGLQGQLDQLGDRFDLTEPFGRIREAIDEARGTKGAVC
jgi:hypothetical protein